MIEIKRKMAFTVVRITGESLDAQLLFRTKESAWRKLREMMIEFCSPGIEVKDRTTGKTYFINGRGTRLEMSDEVLGLKEVRKHLR